MNRFIKTVLTGLSVVLISSCTSGEKVPPRLIHRTVIVKPTAFTTHQGEVKIAESARSISQSLDQLAQIEKAVHPTLQIPAPPNPASIGMANRASIDWYGPTEPLLRKIALASGYRLNVIGQQPAVPILIAVHATDEPLGDILRDVIYQSARKADVVVYPRKKVIELRYFR